MTVSIFFQTIIIISVCVYPIEKMPLFPFTCQFKQSVTANLTVAIKLTEKHTQIETASDGAQTSNEPTQANIAKP